MTVILDLVQAIVVMGLCLYGLWELWGTRARGPSKIIWFAALISLVIMFFVKLVEQLLSPTLLSHYLYLLVDVLFVSLVVFGTARIRRIMVRLSEQLASKRRAESELARNREHLQQLIAQRTEALRGEILQRKALQDDLARHSSALEKDLSAAARAQAAMQQSLPTVSYLDLAAQTFAREQVNGDLYYVAKRSDGSVDLLVGDAMGHGAAAGFITVLTHTALRILDKRYSPGELLEQLNDLMVEQNSGVYLTAVMARIEPNGQCCIAHAGHPPAMLLRTNGTVEPVAADGFALGMFDRDDAEIAFQEVCFQLKAGERLLLYSDGLTELRDAQDVEFGSEGVFASMREAADRTLSDTLAHVLETAYDHCGARPVDDDVTLMLVEYKA